MAYEDENQPSGTPFLDAKMDALYGNTKQERVTLASAQKEQMFSPDDLPTKEEYFRALNPDASEGDLLNYRTSKVFETESKRLAAERVEYEKANRDLTAGEKLQDVGVTGLRAGRAIASSVYHGLDTLSAATEDTLLSKAVNVASKLIGGEGTKTLDEGVEDSLGFSPSVKLAEVQKDIMGLHSKPTQYDYDRVQESKAKRKVKEDKILKRWADDPDVFQRIGSQIRVEAEGAMGAVADFIEHPVTLAATIGESLPQMLIPGAIASKSIKALQKSKGKSYLATEAGKAEVNKIATQAGVGYSAFSEGMSNGGDVHAKVLATPFEDLYRDSPEFNKLIEQGVTATKARRQLANKARDITVSIAGTVGGLTSWKLGTGQLEGKFFKAGSGLDKAFVKGVTVGAVSEGVEETIQGMAGQLAGNIGEQQTTKPDQRISEGLGEAAATGLLTGAVSGGGIAGLSNANLGVAKKSSGKMAEIIRDRASPKEVREAVKNKDLSKLIEPEHKLDAMLKDGMRPDKGTPEYAPHLEELQDQLGKYYSKLVKQMKAHQADNTDPTETDKGFQEYKYFKQAIQTLKAVNTVDNIVDTKGTIEKVVEATEPTPELTTDVDKVIRTFGSDMQSMSLEQGESLLASKNLNPQQRKKIAARVEVLKTMEDVTSDVFFGKADSKFEGIVSLVDRIGAAMEQGNKGRAETVYKKLNAFRIGHIKKQKDFTAAMVGYKKRMAHSKYVYSDAEQKAIDHVNTAYANESLQEGRDVVGPGFDRLTNRVTKESKALNAATKEVFAGITGKDVTTKTKTKAVPKTQESPFKSDEELGELEISTKSSKKTTTPPKKKEAPSTTETDSPFKSDDDLKDLGIKTKPKGKEADTFSEESKSVSEGHSEVKPQPPKKPEVTKVPYSSDAVTFEAIKETRIALGKYRGVIGTRIRDAIGNIWAIESGEQVATKRSTSLKDIIDTELDKLEGVERTALEDAISQILTQLKARETKPTKEPAKVVLQRLIDDGAFDGTGRKVIAQVIIDSVPDNVTVEIVKPDDANLYLPNDDTAYPAMHLNGTIYIADNLNTEFFNETLLHETIHGVLVPLAKAGGKKTPAEAQFYNDINKLLKDMRKIAKKDGSMDVREIKYALQNVDEFLAMGMSNPVVMKWLSRNGALEGKSFLTQFTEAVAKLLGIKKEHYSALEKMLDITSPVLDTSSVKTRKKRVNPNKKPTTTKRLRTDESTVTKKEDTEEGETSKDESYDLASNIINNGIGSEQYSPKGSTEIKYPKLDNVLKYFYNVLGKATSPLRTIPNLFDNIDRVDDLDEAQLAALGLGPDANEVNVVSFVNEFSNKFDTIFKAKGEAYSFQDPITWLMKGDGSKELPTEVLDALATTALQGMTDMVFGGMYADKRKVNQLAGNTNENGDPTKEQYALLTTAGDYWSMVANDLGKQAITAMGLKPNKDITDELTAGSLQVSIGNHILGTLAEMGIIEQVTISGKDAVEIGISVEKKAGITKQGKAATQDLNAKQFVRVLPQTNEAGYLEANDKAQAFADMIRESNGVLNKLTDMESRITEPSFEVPKEAPTKIRGSKMQKVPEAQREALLASSERPNVIFKRNFEFIKQFKDPDQRQALYELQGFDTTYETEKHINQHKPIEAKNQQIKKEIDDFFDFVDRIEGWNDAKGIDTEFYFNHYVSKNMRAGIDSNTVNPNTGKFTRFFLGIKSKERTITNANKDQFLLAVAEGLDVSVDNLSTSDSLSELYTILDNSEELRDAIANIQDTDDTGQILEAAKNLGMKAHGLVALIAYSDYIASEGKPFKTTLYREVDGKTNGVIIGLLQFMAARGKTPSQKLTVLRQMVAKGGIFTDGTKNFSDFISTGQLDTYQNTVIEWSKAVDTFGSEYLNYSKADLEAIIEDKDTDKASKRMAKGALDFKKGNVDAVKRLGAVQRLIGNFYEDGAVTKDTRELVKFPTMTTVYGRAVKGIIEEFGEVTLQNIYDELIKESNAGNEKRVNEIFANVNTLTGDTYKASTDPDGTILPIDFLFDKGTEERLVNAVTSSYGVSLGHAVTSVFGEFIEQKTEINNAFKLMHEGFIQLYDKKIKEAIDKKMSNLKKGEWARPSLTQSEVDAINNELIDSMPIFKSYFAKTTEEGMNPMKVVNSARAEDSLVTRSAFNKNLPNKVIRSLDADGKLVENSVEGSKTVNGSSNTKTWGEPGVGGAILGIHSIDSATMMQVIKEHAVLNIFDAIGVDPDNSLGATEALNKAFELAVFDYSIREAVNESLIRTMGILQKDHPAIIDDLDAKLQVGIDPDADFDYRKEHGIGFGAASVESYLEGYAINTATLVEERAEFRKEITSIIQYTPGEGGGNSSIEPSKAEIHETLSNLGSEVIKETDARYESIESDPAVIAATESVSDRQSILDKHNKAHAKRQAKHDKANFKKGSEAGERSLDELDASDTRGEKKERALSKAQGKLSVLKGKMMDAIDSATGQPMFGSTPDNPIDTENFTAYKTEEVTRTNSMSMFEELGVEGNIKDSDEHTSHLRGVLTGIINKVLDPIIVNLGRSGSKTKGLINSQVYVNSAISSGLLGFSTLMSSREVYVHEMFHAVTLNAFNEDSALLQETKRIYRFVRDLKDSEGNLVIGPHTFMNKGVTFNDPSYFEELEAATNMYEYMFGDQIVQQKATTIDAISGQEIETSFSNALPEFVTYAITNENFIAELAKINVNVNSRLFPKMKDKSISSWFTELLENILNWFSASITGTRKHNTADKKLYSLARQLSSINDKQESMLQLKANKAYDLGSKAVNKSIAMITSPLRKLVDRANPKPGSILDSTKTVAGVVLSGNLRMDGLLTAIQDTRVNMNLSEESITGATINELKGKDLTNRRYHDLRRLSNKMIDQTRHQIDTHVAAQFKDSFNEYTKEKGTTLTKGLIKTDLTSIALDDDGNFKYSATDLERLYSDPRYLQSRITAINNRIDRAYSPEVATWFKSMSASLGKYMAVGIPIENYLMMNADLIAGLYKTDLKVNYDVAKATKLLDELATYHSISFIGEKHQTNMAALIKEEFDTNKKENGITFAMQLHRYNKQEALEKNFDGQKLLMQKGFTREIYNPNIDIITAPITHKREMKARGYTTDGVPVKKDKRVDPNQEEVVHYVNRYANSQDLMAGTASYAGNHAKGRNLVDIYKQQGEETPALEAAFDKPVISRKKKKIIKQIIAGKGPKHTEANGVLAPIFDSKGNVVEYRYLMSEFTKDNLLEKNNNAAQVMSGMVATVTGKVNTNIVNEKLIQAAHDDFSSNGERGNPKKWAAIGPNVSDPKYREIYFMLPDEAKKNIRDIWGPSKTMYIRTEVAVLSFGQRKWSVTNLRKLKRENLNSYNAMKQMANNVAAAVLNNKAGRFTETVLMESTKLVKDAIVIKSGGVLLGNVISNAILLKVLGVPIADILKDHAKAVVYARRFQKDTQRLDALNTLQNVNKDKRKDKKITREIKELEDAISINPVKDLMDIGIHQSIVEDIGIEDTHFSYKTKLEDKLVENKVTGAVIKATPDIVKSIGKNVLMTHDSTVYKFMRDATQLSDFASRYVLHKHNMKSAKGKPANEVRRIRRESIDMIEDTFINYDLPTHGFTQYANDTFLFPFSKFFIRIQKVIMYITRHHPGSLLAFLLLEMGLGFGNIEDITDSLLTLTEFMGKISLDIFGTFAEIWESPLITNILF